MQGLILLNPCVFYYFIIVFVNFIIDCLFSTHSSLETKSIVPVEKTKFIDKL